MTWSIKYYGSNNTTAHPAVDLSDDVMHAVVTDEYNTISMAELTLNNETGKYTTNADPYNVPAPDRDIEVIIGGNSKFKGMVVEKDPSPQDGTIVIRCLGYTELTRRKYIRCWSGIFRSKSFYQVMTQDPNRMTWGPRSKGYMSPTSTKVDINTAGVVNDASTGIVVDQIKFPASATVFDGLKLIADTIGYYFYVLKTIDGSYNDVLTLYFKAKGSSADPLITATKGGNMLENNITISDHERVDRVMVYGSKELGIAASAGASELTSAQDYTTSEERLRDQVTAQTRADYLLTQLGQQWYEGDVVLSDEDFSTNPHVDGQIRVLDAETGMDHTFRISKVETTIDADQGYEVRVFVSANPYTLGKTVAEIRADLLFIDAFRSDVEQTNECVLIIIDELSIEDEVIVGYMKKSLTDDLSIEDEVTVTII